MATPVLAPRSRSALYSQQRGYGPYLEGLRGLAALYVVLHHATLQTREFDYGREHLSSVAEHWIMWCLHGDQAVAIFITLSGYCLMLPVVASGRLRGGLVGYLKRRAQRILPAYYATLALVITIVWLVPPLGVADRTRWDVALPVLDTGVILSHLLLIHDLSVDWIWKLNGPLWSVAVESQLYCVFPLLLALFNCCGGWLGALLGLGLGYLASWFVAFFDASLAMRTHPWYLGLFAIGMAFAVCAHSAYLRSARRAWLPLAGAFWGASWLADMGLRGSNSLVNFRVASGMVVDPLLALALGCVLLHCTAATQTGRLSRLRKQLEAPVLLSLGSFSYSLYLIHDPVLSFVHRLWISWGLSAEIRLWLDTLLGVPLAMLCAYGLYRLVERPCLPARPATSASQLAGVAARFS